MVTVTNKDTPLDILQAINNVLGPVEAVCKTLSENPQGTPNGRQQAADNATSIGNFNHKTDQIIAAYQATVTPTLTSTLSRGFGGSVHSSSNTTETSTKGG